MTKKERVWNWKYRFDMRVILGLQVFSLITLFIFGYGRAFSVLFSGLVGLIVGTYLERQRVKKEMK